jgi:hypothetical protein
LVHRTAAISQFVEPPPLVQSAFVQRWRRRRTFEGLFKLDALARERSGPGFFFPYLPRKGISSSAA